MLVDKLVIYKSLDLQKPVIPARSSLYSLEPLGVATPYVESLTGYVARLAEAHCVSTGELILSEVGPLIKEGYVFDKNGGIGKIYGCVKHTTALNGTGLMATSLVQALAALTLRSELCYLTMLTWANVISFQGLIRTVKAWCPICYEEWSAAEQVIYEPLIWTLNVVTVCPCHHQPFQIQCSHCHKQLSLLDGRSRPGYCSKCGGWLGISPNLEASNYKFLSLDELKWQKWVINNVGEILATAPFLSSPLPRERIRKALEAYIEQATKGKVSTFAYLCGMPSHQTLRDWLLGKTIPQLSSLLNICYCLETSLLDLLMKEVVVVNSDRLTTLLQSKQQPQTLKTRKRFDFDRARSILLSALNESPPPSLAELSRRLGESNTGNLYRHFSDLCHAISSRHADYKKAKSLAEMRRSLETALESDEYPPPCLLKVVRPLKHKTQTFYRNFPDLCHAISARYLSYREAVRMERIEQLCQEVRRVALELHATGIKPTATNVKRLMTKSARMRDKEAQAALREVQRELGYQ